MKFKMFFTIGLGLLGVFCSQPLLADQYLDIPVAQVIPSNACTTQAIAIHGTSHIGVNVTVNKNSVHLKMHANMQDVSGVRLIDGSKYSLVDGSNVELNISGLLEAQINVDFNLIGQGVAPNMRMRMVFHLTIDPNGNVSLDLTRGGSIICQ